jgi:hypothetical protein
VNDGSRVLEALQNIVFNFTTTWFDITAHARMAVYAMHTNAGVSEYGQRSWTEAPVSKECAGSTPVPCIIPAT